MALMEFREPNQVRWTGSRPAHRGTQIIKQFGVISGTAIVHTVTAGKVFYLCECLLSTFNSVSSYGYGFIRDGADALIRRIIAMRVQAGSTFVGPHNTFWPPIEIPAGYDICVLSSALAIEYKLSIHGWEE